MKIPPTLKGAALSVAFTFLLSPQARASLVVSYAESPGEQVTRVNGTSTMTFNGISPGFHTNLEFKPGDTVMGVYDQITIANSDQYGGAYNTPYGTVSGFTSTLTLATRMAYFGMWWSAGDPANVLEFYDGDALIARFTTTNLVNVLPEEYLGNPTAGFLGQNGHERYVFLNFFGEDGAKWDEIRITNSGASGFESDNHTIREAEFDEETEGPRPGVVFEKVDGETSTPVGSVPEPGTMGLLAGASVLLVFFRKRKQTT